MSKKQRQEAKTLDEQIRELRALLDTEIDQALYERAEDVLEDLGAMSLDGLVQEAFARVDVARNGQKNRKQFARDLRRWAVYALLAASKIDGDKGKVG